MIILKYIIILNHSYRCIYLNVSYKFRIFSKSLLFKNVQAASFFTLTACSLFIAMTYKVNSVVSR